MKKKSNIFLPFLGYLFAALVVMTLLVCPVKQDAYLYNFTRGYFVGTIPTSRLVFLLNVFPPFELESMDSIYDRSDIISPWGEGSMEKTKRWEIDYKYWVVLDFLPSTIFAYVLAKKLRKKNDSF
jgi:hypothetical protein